MIDALAEAERSFGKFHIACNNAGVPMHGTRLVDVTPADWAFVMGVNVWGIIHGIRHFLPAILKHGEEGHVVNTASVAAIQNRRGTNQGPYSMSKYAALSLSEALEQELEGTNVGVSALCPGPIETNIAQGARNRPDISAARSCARRTKRFWPNAWPEPASTRSGSATGWSTRSAPRPSTPLSARSPPISFGPVTAASRPRPKTSGRRRIRASSFPSSRSVAKRFFMSKGPAQFGSGYMKRSFLHFALRLRVETLRGSTAGTSDTGRRSRSRRPSTRRRSASS